MEIRFFNRSLTALRVLEGFFDTVFSCSLSWLVLSASKIACMAAASSCLAREPVLEAAGSASWDRVNLTIGGDAIDNLGAIPSGDGGWRLRQQIEELMMYLYWMSCRGRRWYDQLEKRRELHIRGRGLL